MGFRQGGGGLVEDRRLRRQDGGSPTTTTTARGWSWTGACATMTRQWSWIEAWAKPIPTQWANVWRATGRRVMDARPSASGDNAAA
ncbi:hypothetical protein E2562_028639 [Oryza meyeriana var. granulata]|uniref:Uncharacterized protein n=1 Tax=Oryza meyeriana var. granulata TaxID=110450 RepID=A0A6G1D7U2_9ORYZ|nr:hypothetical protein E2562_028639 [Oryza meyeriana var. granulata]